MNVVIVHDYLTQRGGAERVVLELARAFPGSTLMTSVYDPDGTYPEFADLPVRTLGLERIPAVRHDPRLALPVLADLFRSQQVDADVLLCSTSGFAHLVRNRGVKVVYCHNPPRWLYQWDDYRLRLPKPAQMPLVMLRRRLLRLDREGAREASLYLANSVNSAQRIRSAYGLTPRIVNPPRGLEPAGPVTPVPGIEPGFVLTIGRPRGYKRTELLLEAVAALPDVRLVTVGCRPERRWPPNIRQLMNVSDEQLRWLYGSARALLVCSHEDFGLTPVEAFGFGLPVGATQEGGYLETCIDGLTGLWLDHASSDALGRSIRALLARSWDADAIRRHGARWTVPVFHEKVRAAVESATRGAPVREPGAISVSPIRRYPVPGWLRPLTGQRAPTPANTRSSQPQ